jgi:fructose/tagatose bisphosphate aldolase
MFELSRSEMQHTDQRPAEYTSVILAAAIKEGFRGPVFLQGDHFQVNARDYVKHTDSELAGLRNLIDESIHAGFLNIELDTSTLTNPNATTLADQQRSNYELCALLSDYIRTHQPPEVTISIGGEIGEGSERSSDVHELRAFMDGYRSRIRHTPGLSKLSVNVGTTQGGVVLPSGAIAAVSVDFERLKELSSIARREYAMGGAAQHGTSTLPQDAFHQFVTAGAIEVHLATAFQNLVFELLPAELVTEIRGWVFANKASERKPGDTDEQFFYKTRRQACGAFKKALWNLAETERSYIRSVFEDRFALLYRQLGVEHTADTVANVVNETEMHKRMDDFVPSATVATAGHGTIEA